MFSMVFGTFHIRFRTFLKHLTDLGVFKYFQAFFHRFKSNKNLLNQLEKCISIIEQWSTALNLEDRLNTFTEQILRFSDSYHF